MSNTPIVFALRFSFVLLALAAVSVSQALTINLRPNEELAANGQALAAFRRAADTWEKAFVDPVVVTIDAGLESFGSDILGGASSVQLSGGYDLMRSVLVFDEESEGAHADPVVSALPTAGDIVFAVPTGINWNGQIGATKANLKALGFSNLDLLFGESDGQIMFSKDFAFDYDRSDGIAGGAYDFESVAMHEIGHTLGFVSIVDVVDGLLANGLVGSVAPRVLDLYRFASGLFNPSTYAEFSTAPRSILPGFPSHMDLVDMEIPLSTGFNFGDTKQASHWKDGLGLGLMDPTLAPEELSGITERDLRSFDVIGWEPRGVPDGVTTVSLLLVSLAGIVAVRRRHR